MIDFDKCFGCKKGIGYFIIENNEVKHYDFFATAEAGAIYKCENSEEIIDKLEKFNDNNDILKPISELNEKFEKQEYWWDDIIRMAYDLFKEQSKVTEFFNIEENDTKLYKSSNLNIETTLIKLFEENNLKISEEDYPDLIMFTK